MKIKLRKKYQAVKGLTEHQGIDFSEIQMEIITF